MTHLPLQGLYAITDNKLIAPLNLTFCVELVLKGGASMIQYRDKTDDAPRRELEAQALHDLCQRYTVPLIISDDVALAKKISAEGVHLGKYDATYHVARDLLGTAAIIGISCYDSLDRAHQAALLGADYVAFGSFFPSRTKPNAVRAVTTLLQEARKLVSIPIVAIGGITPENGILLLEAGADILAVISGLFGDPDPEGAAKRYAALFSKTPQRSCI